jgi:tRNA-splicing ligase RtcB
MPDAHQGYGLPVGGVLATRGAVIPYAVGVDIACRMKLTIFDLPSSLLDTDRQTFKSSLSRCTRFGVGQEWSESERMEHPVMDMDWHFHPVVSSQKRKAAGQLGTSGSGNHFAEFGDVGGKIALMTHSGSRGPGAAIANHFSKLAKELHPELPKELENLAWLDMNTQEGQDYWKAMQLMGEFASANHLQIHQRITNDLTHFFGQVASETIENHHNFAWEEEYNGETLIVHRKGATPAQEGVMGIIPGSMATPGFIVRGKGNGIESLNSASHGAGRRLSRTKAKKAGTWDDLNAILKTSEVELLSAGLDESPWAYKDIHQVMEQQTSLVDVLGMFTPRIVKMATAKERPED